MFVTFKSYCFVIVLLSVSTRARAQEQGPIPSSQRSLGHSLFKQKFCQKFLRFFLLFVVVVFYYIKISTPWRNAHASMGEASILVLLITVVLSV